MKKTFLILGGVAVLLITGVVAVAWFALDKAQAEINKLKIAPAMRERWAKRRDDQSEDEVPKEKIVVRATDNGTPTAVEETKTNPNENLA